MADRVELPSPHQQSTWVELLIVALVVAIYATLACVPEHFPLLLHLYYLPVALGGFFLRNVQTRRLALLCVAMAALALIPELDDPVRSDWYALRTTLFFGFWGATIAGVAMLIDARADYWDGRLKDIDRDYRKELMTDALTAIASRRGLQASLKSWLLGPSRPEEFGMLMADVDHFKRLNDRHGHAAGDAVLTQVAARLRESVRDRDVVARYGGEEFAVLLPHASPERCLEVAERMRQAVAKARYEYGDLSLRVTMSFGAACAQPQEDAESLARRADVALYAAKDAGRNRVCWHDGVRTSVRPLLHEGSALQIDAARLPGEGKVLSDEVTELATWEALEPELTRRIAETRRYGDSLTLAVVQMRDYATLDPSYGFAQRQMAVHTAMLLSSVLRESDAVFRLEEDAFGVLLPRSNLKQSAHALNRVKSRAAGYRDAALPELSFAVRVGAAEASAEDDAMRLLARARARLRTDEVHLQAEASPASGGELAQAQVL